MKMIFASKSTDDITYITNKKCIYETLKARSIFKSHCKLLQNKKCQISKPVPKPPSKSTMEKLLAHKDDKSFG